MGRSLAGYLAEFGPLAIVGTAGAQGLIRRFRQKLSLGRGLLNVDTGNGGRTAAECSRTTLLLVTIKPVEYKFIRLT
jgi:hypothetical protein